MDLLDQLRAKRQEIALREGIELYRVFTNATLLDTVAAAPKTKADLLAIKGWGPKKVTKYGDEILSLLNQQVHSHSSSPSADVLSVSAFLNLVNQTLYSLGALRVRGEITEINFRGGFAFAKLKDSQGDSVLNIYLSPGVVSFYGHLLTEGLEVVALGRPNLYKSGRLSLVVSSLTPVGEGALKKAFLALQAKLAARGWFAPERKRPLPRVIRRLGLITSRDGRALQDFLQNLGRYGFSIFLLDVRVEGDYAESQLVAAVNRLNQRSDLDALILIRGGGSLESLQAFNSERLAGAIIASRLPVLVGVGHEADVTISDFVADLRASTPTGVAVALTRHRELFLEKINAVAEVFTNRLSDNFISLNHRLHALSLELKSGLARIFDNLRRLESLFLRRLDGWIGHLTVSRHRLRLAAANLIQPLVLVLENYQHRLALAARLLDSLDPDSVLKRGYSLLLDESGRVVKDASTIVPGQRLRARLRRGSLTVRVEDVK